MAHDGDVLELAEVDEWGEEGRVIRVTIVPIDKGARREDVGEGGFAGNAEGSVERGAVGEEDGVVVRLQVGESDLCCQW